MGPRNSSNQAVLDSAVRHEAQWGGSTGKYLCDSMSV